MEILHELAQILTKRSLNSLELLGPFTDENSKVNVFYEGLLENKFKTDQEAAAFFYNTDASNSSYKSLKSNLKTRLTNLIFFLSLKKPKYNEYEQSYFFCCKNMAAAKILIRLHATEAGINLCKKVFRTALKNEFSNFIAESARFIRGYYATRYGDMEKFNYYNEAYKKAEKDRIGENLAHEFYLRLMLPYTKEKAQKEETYAMAKGFLSELEPHLADSQSPYLHFLAYYIEVIIQLSINDYKGTIEICNKAINFFESKPYVYKTALNVFLHKTVICYTQLRQFEKCEEIEEKTLNLLQAGSYNWYRDREIFFHLAIHTKNYQAAYEKFSMAINHRKFQFLSQPVKETWKIYESYLHFLVTLEKITPAPLRQSFQ